MKGVTKKEEEKQQEATKVFDVTCKNAREISDNTVSFDMVVNFVTIYGMIYREYVNKEGKEGYMISFPSRKGTGKYADKYFSHAWFPINNDLKENIRNQLLHLLNEV